MQLPFFFEENLPSGGEFNLGEESSRHIVQVLRMHPPDQLIITNGKGETLIASILSSGKKTTTVKIKESASTPRRNNGVSVAISLIKNKSRFEWFLEKATEMGVSEIIPLVCHRTEKQHVNRERMKHILVSAMLQSQQVWMPLLREPLPFADILSGKAWTNKFIAHCAEGEKKYLSVNNCLPGDRLILIGPEGDFTGEEIASATEDNFIPVSLGETRLRTETAGLVAAVLLLNK